MNILLVSPFLPYQRAPHAGGRYVYELLCHLSVRHRVDLATRYEKREEELLADLRHLCRHIYHFPYSTSASRGLPETLALVGDYLAFSRAAHRLIAAGDYDLVLVEWVEAAILVGRHRIPMLLDSHDVITKPAERAFRQATGIRRAMKWFIYRLTLTVERMVARRFDTVIVRSEYDKQYLQTLLPEGRSVVIPHPAGLDLRDSSVSRRPGTILFLASFKYRPVNVQAALWFYRQVFPLVRKRVPEARFVIAGYGPTAELIALAADPQVEVAGFVDDLDRCYKEAAVFVAPILTGGGIIVKLLDALAAGTPTVATTFGNEGVGAMPGRDLLVADDPAAFAEGVARLLLDREYAAQLGESGRRFVRERYGRDTVMARLDALVAELAGGISERDGQGRVG